MREDLESHYLQRIAEIAAGSERRLAHLSVANGDLQMEVAALKLEVENLERTTRDLALGSLGTNTGEDNELSDSP